VNEREGGQRRDATAVPGCRPPLAAWGTSLRRVPKPTATDSRIILPGAEPGPLRKILGRVAIALALIVFVALISYAGRDGYVDPDEGDGKMSLLDAFYYSTVSITTTGYGDIRPISDEARFVTTALVTPARVLFLILLVGTTLEILAERSRHAIRVARWRRNLHGHTIVCGYGTKGRSAVQTLLGKGHDAKRILVIEQSSEAQARAAADGLAVVGGSAALQDTLREANAADATAIVVAVDRDDAAVLIALTARELNSTATIVAAVREEENVHLLHQSGADAVITSSGAAGRLLGLSTETPKITEVLEDLLTVGEGLDIAEREVGPEDAGPVPSHAHEAIIVAVIRGDEVLRFDDERATELEPGDRVVELLSHRH
jgi:voltage-gated potassium channel